MGTMVIISCSCSLSSDLGGASETAGVVTRVSAESTEGAAASKRDVEPADAQEESEEPEGVRETDAEWGSVSEDEREGGPGVTAPSVRGSCSGVGDGVNPRESSGGARAALREVRPWMGRRAVARAWGSRSMVSGTSGKREERGV